MNIARKLNYEIILYKFLSQFDYKKMILTFIYFKS